MIGKKRILITGADGFLGTAVCRNLEGRNGWTCYLCVESVRADLGSRQFKCNLLDFSQVEKLIGYAKPNRVIHLAARTPQSPDGKPANWGDNLRMTSNLAIALRRCGPERIIHVGTAQEYGAAVCAEDQPVQPMNLYAFSKVGSYEILRTSGLPFVHLRASVLYGPGQKGSFFIPSLFRAAVEAKEFATSSGTKRRDFLYVTDAANAICLALEKRRLPSGIAINIACGKSHALSQVADYIKNLLGPGFPKIIWGALADSSSEPASIEVKINRARKLLGFFPVVSLKEGLRETAISINLEGQICAGC
ncbi:MAG: NAD(P)-dependent oxidoreductase [Elusimicrobia bacterium]|nr:NAD(P)-dependent oxidoreductase [Elusimicrobiota bacterium]